jgi:hypothetical protein
MSSYTDVRLKHVAAVSTRTVKNKCIADELRKFLVCDGKIYN